MIPIRERLPERRLLPSRNPTGENWADHKPDLKEDFHSHCGYCGAFDGYRHTYYEVDHFVPKSFFIYLGNIGLTQYSNLVYSCKFCNGRKKALWPSQSETIFNDGEVGFVDPCSAEYETHFYRLEDGEIMWRTELGRWMSREAFKFDERQQSIKVLWNMRRLCKSIDSLTEILKTTENGGRKYRRIKEKMGEFALQYFKFHKELIEYHDR